MLHNLFNTIDLSADLGVWNCLECYTFLLLLHSYKNLSESKRIPIIKHFMFAIEMDNVCGELACGLPETDRRDRFDIGGPVSALINSCVDSVERAEREEDDEA